MKTKTQQELKSLIREGRIECMTDLKIGLVNIRWIRTGKREWVEVSK